MLGVEAVISDVCRKFGVDEASILRSQRNRTTRGILALSLVRRCGLTQRDVVARLGLASGSAVSYLVRKIKADSKRDTTLRQQLESLTK